jgi:Heterokaryon incompatibility protein (HET)
VYQRGPSELPSRVIDVGPPDGSKEPFLYCSKGEKDHYITLSHRWANYDLIKTTSTILQKQMTEITLHALPKTLQDAVFITRKLGIRFLWIDCICIIQDDISDWSREAMKMSKIFKNSLLTIAGTEPIDHTIGMFAKRQRFRTRPCQLNLRISCRHKTMFRHSGPLFAFADRSKDGIFCRPPGELDSRAWVLQEQLLSPRVLSCAGGELFWDCVCLNASETHPNGFPTLAYGVDNQVTTFTKFKEATLPNAFGNHVPSKEHIYSIWRQIVEDYSQRALTVGTDRIIAISGITSQIGLSLRDNYIFGLWEKHLVTENLWKELLWRTHPKVIEEGCMQSNVPSWSWLSTMEPVIYDVVDLRIAGGVTSEAKITGVRSNGREIEIEGLIARQFKEGIFTKSLGDEIRQLFYLPLREWIFYGQRRRHRQQWLERKRNSPRWQQQISSPHQHPPFSSQDQDMHHILNRNDEPHRLTFIRNDNPRWDDGLSIDLVTGEEKQPYYREGEVREAPPIVSQLICPISEFPRENRPAEFSVDGFTYPPLSHPDGDIWCMEIARINNHQLCLCLVEHTESQETTDPDNVLSTSQSHTGGDQNRLQLRKFRRIGICSWNMTVYPNLDYERHSILLV